MMKMWKKVEETADECMQLEANFDIPLFDGDDGDMFDENDVNPFITSNQGFQTLVSPFHLCRINSKKPNINLLHLSS